MICAGCPYRLFGQIVGKMRAKGKLEAVFGDIGCNTLLHFLNAMDTALAMGASEAKRLGYVLSRPEAASKCLAVLGDGTECHSGMDATRNTIFRNIPGVKVILNNEWTAMTGGQPSPTSPANLAGDPNVFDLNAASRRTAPRSSWSAAMTKRPWRRPSKTPWPLPKRASSPPWWSRACASARCPRSPTA
jgi:indolepyruvate ferredoxin oxidoreductase, alpha subunit